MTSSVIQASVSHKSSMWSNKNSWSKCKLKLCTVAIFCIFIFFVVLVRVLVIIPGPFRFLVSAFLFRVLVTERSVLCLRIDQFRSGPFRILVIPPFLYRINEGCFMFLEHLLIVEIKFAFLHYLQTFLLNLLILYYSQYTFMVIQSAKTIIFEQYSTICYFYGQAYLWNVYFVQVFFQNYLTAKPM